MLADIAHEAGLPDGAFNVRPGDRRGGRRRARPPTPVSTGSRSPARSRPASSWRRPPRANLTPVSLELGGKSPFVAFADADLDAVVAAGREPVRQRGPGLPGRDAAAGRALDARRVPRPVRGGGRGDPRRATRATRPPTSGRRSRASTSNASTGSCSARRPTAPRSCFGGGPNEDLGGLYYRPTLFADVARGLRDPHAGGLRARPHAADVRGRGRGDRARERDRLRPGRDPVHRRPRARRTRLRRAWWPAPSG